MKVTELRIGNWINEETGTIPYKVTSDDIFWLSLPQNENKMQPIPLTPEILEKAGFKLDPEFDGFESGKFDIWFYHIENKGFTYSNMVDGGKLIEYAHELQNLYFALTGEELNIQL